MFLTRFDTKSSTNDFGFANFMNDMFKANISKDKVRAEGIPNLWGASIIMKFMLEKGDEVSKSLLFSYLKGLWLGTLTVDYEKINNSSFDKVILSHFPLKDKYKDAFMKIDGKNSLPVLKYENSIVAYNYPETLFVPSADYSEWPNKPKKEESSLLKIEKTFTELIDNHKKAKLDFKKFLLNLHKYAKDVKNKLLVKLIDSFYKNVSGHNIAEESSIDLNRSDTESSAIESLFISGESEKALKIDIKPFSFSSLLNVVKFDLKGGKVFIDELEIDIEELGLVVHNDKVYLIRDVYSSSGILEKDGYVFKIEKNKLVVSPVNELTYIKNRKEITLEEIIVLNSIFVEKLFVIENNGRKIIPKKPVYKRYDFLLEECGFIDNVGSEVRYKLKIKGFGAKDKTLKHEILNEKTKNNFYPQLFIWPNIKLENWNLYYLYFSPIGKESLAAKVYIGDREYFYDKPKVYKLNNIPDEIVLIEGKEEFQERGIFDFSEFIKTEEVKKTKKETLKIGVDFGTSNTSAYFSAANDYVIYDKDLMGAFLIEKQQLDYFLPIMDVEILPSELFIKGTNFNWENGLQDYTIPYFIREDGSLIQEEIIIALINYIKTNFKWSGTDPIGSDTERNYFKSYIYLILQFLVARGVKHGYGKIKFGFSYPLSFSSPQIKMYFNILKNVIEKINKETDNIIEDTISFVSESEAAAFSKREIDADNVIVIDAGGGSTDIAVIQNDKPTYFTSVEFGGRDLIKKASKGSIKEEQKLEWQIRANGVGNISDNFKNDFFNILLELPRRIALKSLGKTDNPFEKPANIRIVLMGQSWGFTQGNYNNVVERFFNGIIAQYNLKEAKKILCKGIIEIDKRDIKNNFELRDYQRKDIVGTSFTLKERGTGKIFEIKWHYDVPYNNTGIDFSDCYFYLEKKEFNELINGNTTLKNLLKDREGVRWSLGIHFFRPNDNNNNYVLKNSINGNALVLLIKRDVKEKFING
jgi:hypothetical protein